MVILSDINFESYTQRQIKDGVFYNGRYKKEELIFKSPHVIVFANYRPDLTKLTADRWIGCVFKIRHPHMVLIEDKIKIVDGVAEFEHEDALNHIGMEVGSSPAINNTDTEVDSNDNNTINNTVVDNIDTEVDSNDNTINTITVDNTDTDDVSMVAKWFRSL